MCEIEGQMALFVSTHAEILLLCKLKLLNWKPGPKRSTYCPPSGNSGCQAEGSQVPLLLCSFQFQPCHRVHRGAISPLPLKSPFRKLAHAHLPCQTKLKSIDASICTENTFFLILKPFLDNVVSIPNLLLVTFAAA